LRTTNGERRYLGGNELKLVLKFAGVGAAIAALLSLAEAQEPRIYREGSNWVQEFSGNLNAARILRVKVDNGNVRVEGGSQPGISYNIHRRAYTSSEARARREFESYKVSTYMKGDTAWIVAEWQGARHKRECAGDFVVKVPRNLELAKIETSGGSVTTTGINGRAEMQTGVGSIHLDDIAGAVNVETGGGTIDIGNVGGDITAHTGGGTIKIAAAKGKINAESGGGTVIVMSGQQGATLETGAGNIHVVKLQGTVRASTAGGNVDLGDIDGPAEIETGGGSIRLGWAKGPVKAETGGGSIELNGVPSARAETGTGGIIAKFQSSNQVHSDSWLETNSGDIVVYLANDIPISIRAAIDLANGHTISSDFADIHVNVEGGSWGPKTVTAEGNLNGGGPVLKVRTSTGNIVFLRASR
jgi:hypothetical protein